MYTVIQYDSVCVCVCEYVFEISGYPKRNSQETGSSVYLWKDDMVIQWTEIEKKELLFTAPFDSAKFCII